MQNQWKIDARKSDAKMMENGAKMEPKREQNSMKNQLNMRSKNDAKLSAQGGTPATCGPLPWAP